MHPLGYLFPWLFGCRVSSRRRSYYLGVIINVVTLGNMLRYLTPEYMNCRLVP